MKRICSILLAVICLFAALQVSAISVDPKKQFDIVSLGIMEGDENGELHLEDALTRAEFAAVITRLLRYENLVDSFSGVPGKFTDVSQDAWYAGYVNLMHGMGIMNGVAENAYAPQQEVTYEQTIKTLVNVLGYSVLAEKKGGYPNGYLAVAGSIGLTREVSKDETFTRGHLLLLLHNALSIDMMVESYSADEEYYIEKGKNFWNLYLSSTTQAQMVKGEGIVTANVDTYLTAVNVSLRPDEVEIDDVIFHAGNTDAYNYIGQRVSYYAMIDESGIRTLLSISPAKGNLVYEINRADVLSADASKVTYEQNGRIKEESIVGATVVKNGRMLLPNAQNADFTGLKGPLTMIDWNDDNNVDVVFLESFNAYRVLENKDGLIEFVPGQILDGSKFLRIDLEDNQIHYRVEDENGNVVDPAEIEADSLLSISQDAGKKLYTIVVSTEKVEGTVSMVDADGVTIGDITYPVYPGYALDFAPGDAGIAYIDHQGYLADFEDKTTTSQYGYLIAATQEGSLNTNVLVKMVIGAQVEFNYDKNTTDLDDANLIPVINCHNEGVRVLETAERIVVNGVSKKNAVEMLSALTPGLYSFETNADGNLTRLSLAEKKGGGTNMTYNAYDKVFGGSQWRTPFAVDQNTIVICLPTNKPYNQASDADYLVPLKISNKATSVTFYAEGYDYDETDKKVDVLVFHDAMDADSVLSAYESSSSIGMVSKNTVTVDEEGLEVRMIGIVDKSGTTDYLINHIPGKNDILTTLTSGDLIYYEVDLFGELSNALVIRSFADGVSSYDDTKEIYGTVNNLEYDEIHTSTANLVTRAYVTTNSGTGTVDIPQRNVPPIFIYDGARKTITMGSISDLFPKSSSETFYALKPSDLAGRAKVCVICR